MKVLIFLSSSGRGGRELNTIRLIPYLHERGIKVEVVVLDCGGYVTKWCSDNGISCQALGFWPNKLNFLAVIWRFFLLLKTTKFDLIQVYGFTGSMVCRFVACPFRTKVVVGIVGSGHFTGLRPLFEKLTKGLVDGYVANSLAGKNKLLELFGVNTPWIEVIHNGVPDIEVSSPCVNKKNCFTVGTIANLRPEKGYDIMLSALFKIKLDLGGQLDITYLIVGDGALKKDLLAQIQKLGLADQVCLLGMVENVAEVLGKLDLFVLPSYSEGLPNALLEAMMAGRCVIATKVGGVPEIIEDGYNGLLVEPGNPEELSKAIQKVILNPQLQKNMALRGRELVYKKYTLSHQAESTIKAWKAVCSQYREAS